MIQEMQKIEWYCRACGVTGTAEMWADLCLYGKVAELVHAHSLKSPGCDGNARKTLRYRVVSDSDFDQEFTKKVRKRGVSSTRAGKKN